MKCRPDRFQEIWFVDFEYREDDGERLDGPWCMVARELRSGRLVRVLHDELAQLKAAPFNTGPDSLFCAWPRRYRALLLVKLHLSERRIRAVAAGVER